MSKYFNYFPKTNYTINGETADRVLKITSRYAFEQKFKENSAVYYEYSVQDSDTPEIIANKLYGSSERHWIVLMLNDIVDPQFDWPLDASSLGSFIEAKYKANANVGQSGVNWAQSHTHSYYKVVERKTNGTSSKLTTKIKVDANTYANTGSSTEVVALSGGKSITISTTKETLSYYAYEVETNESKRIIKLLKPEFAAAIEEELRIVFK
jgi:hypothetical protein